MNLSQRSAWVFVCVAAGCASRGGYAEPGPTSASANPPAAPGVMSGEPMQPSPGSGRHSDLPPRTGITGNSIEAEPGSDPGGECHGDSDCASTSCCAVTACVPRARAADCAAVRCADPCADGGPRCVAPSCVCLGGRCAVDRPH